MTEHVRMLILGSGPAGYTAAIYGARANLSPVLYSGAQVGGQLTTTTEVENFPGFPEGLQGAELMTRMRDQATRLGATMRSAVAIKAELSEESKKVWFDNGDEITTDTLIIATGAQARYLGLPSEEKYKGQGVHACATCDGFFYQGKRVAVVGGGDSAGEEATYLASICTQVYLIVRKPYMRASKAMLDRVERTENLEVLYEHVTEEVLGTPEAGVTGVRVRSTKDNSERQLDIDGFFVSIGNKPASDLFKDQLECTPEGYIVTEGTTQATSIPGVYAAGDVQDPRYRQAVTAAASGCRAACDAERYLGTRLF